MVQGLGAMRSLVWFFLLSWGVAPTRAAEVIYHWKVDAVLRNDLSPDCMDIKTARRTMFLVVDDELGPQFPGPLLEANEGDTIRIQVDNKHPTEGVAIHWHGIHQKGTPYMDGPIGVTQCALGSKQSQEYVFEVYPPGTHYWHAHGSLHLADGLSGVIVVHPKDPEPFTYDDDRILFLQDWYIHTSTQQLIGLLNWPFTWVGNPNSLLINGKGLAPECLANGTNVGNVAVCLPSCQDDPATQLEVVGVEAGKTYRLRLINGGQLVMMNFAIANHNMTIVQVEGTNVEPVVVSSVDLSSGQRYDVLVTMDQEPGSYLMQTTVRLRPIPLVKGMAILQYSSVPNVTFPVDQVPDHAEQDDPEYGPKIDALLLTLNPESSPQASALKATTVSRYVVVGTQNEVVVDGNATRLVWAVNNVTDVKSNSPLIGAAYTAATKLGWPTDIPGTMLLPMTPPFVWNYTQNVTVEGGPGKAVGMEGNVIIRGKQGDVVEIVLQNARALNGVAEFHPWHIHGHSFWVVGSGYGIYDESLVSTYNLENPLLRDSVTLWPLQWVALRFVADNPGVWFFHCHITSHLVMGMGFNMVISPETIAEPSESVTSCGDHGLEAGGSGDDGGSATSGTDKGFSFIGSLANAALMLAFAHLW